MKAKKPTASSKHRYIAHSIVHFCGTGNTYKVTGFNFSRCTGIDVVIFQSSASGAAGRFRQELRRKGGDQGGAHVSASF
jgi:hypothetical protein